MNNPTTPRLTLFTVAVLAGSVSILTDRFFVIGILLIGFSSIILKSKREQKNHWSNPLSKGQIVRGFIPLILVITIIVCLFVIRERGSAPSESTLASISTVFKIVFVIASAVMIVQPWLRWYRSRNTTGTPNESD